MPYALTFRKQVQIADREQYINECCIGGDVVLDRLLPSLRSTYGELQSNQEDWGWFAWFERSAVKLAVDVFTDDPQTGQFQMHLTSRKPRMLFGSKVEDTPELEGLRELVMKELEAWPVADLRIERVDEKYLPRA
jgi:hypothetical protein